MICNKKNNNIINDNISNVLTINNDKIKTCHYCNSTKHLCRDCPIEKANAASYKLIIGKWAEKYVAKYPCPSCKKNTLDFLGNHTPSLDVKCKCCGHMIEVKSKCLSVKKLPKDIFMYHGNFEYYQKRVDQGLTFVFVIYSVDRKSKSFDIRRVYYVDNNSIKNNKIITVKKLENTKNSKIIIPNTDYLEKWQILKI